jgi:hypothetical protein
MVTVCTVFSPSFNHTREYVFRLKKSLERNTTIPFRFVCFTNEELVGIDTINKSWSMSMYGRWLKLQPCFHTFTDRMIYLDMDTVIVGNVDFMLTSNDRFLCRAIDGNRSTHIMSLSESDRNAVYEFWMNGYETLHEGVKRLIKDEADVYDIAVDQSVPAIQDLYPGSVVDFEQAKESIPMGTKVITFTGVNRPHLLDDNNHIKKYW